MPVSPDPPTSLSTINHEVIPIESQSIRATIPDEETDRKVGRWDGKILVLVRLRSGSDSDSPPEPAQR
jgi:hypothetical protein